MMSLFTSFDLTFFKLTWLSLSTFMFMMLKSFFSIEKMNFMIHNFLKTLTNFFYSLKKKNFGKSKMLMIFTTFTAITILNFLSILPYFFSWTSQISIVLFISLTFWLSNIIFQVSKNHKNLMSHFIPVGTPYPLVPFLFIIEMVSNLIRPITVSVRLVANILAGHLLMILLSKISLSNMMPMSILYSMLNTVEMAVALIQSYIYCTMICLYYAEVN